MTINHELQLMCDAYRKEGKIVGFVNGCFDMLHAGHKNLIMTAALNSDVLIVAVNSDQSIKRIKGSLRPLQPCDVRINAISRYCPERKTFICLEMNDDSPVALVHAARPDRIFKQPEYEDARECVMQREAGRMVFLVPRMPGVSTSSAAAGKDI